MGWTTELDVPYAIAFEQGGAGDDVRIELAPQPSGVASPEPTNWASAASKGVSGNSELAVHAGGNVSP